MGEAYKSDIGHEILNPFGERIRVSRLVVRQLDMKGYLRRDRETGLKQIKPDLIGFFHRLEKTTFHRELWAAIGPDFSGPSVVICPCRQCQGAAADLEDTRLSVERSSQVVREVTAKRRAA